MWHSRLRIPILWGACEGSNLCTGVWHSKCVDWNFWGCVDSNLVRVCTSLAELCTLLSFVQVVIMCVFFCEPACPGLKTWPVSPSTAPKTKISCAILFSWQFFHGARAFESHPGRRQHKISLVIWELPALLFRERQRVEWTHQRWDSLVLNIFNFYKFSLRTNFSTFFEKSPLRIWSQLEHGSNFLIRTQNNASFSKQNFDKFSNNDKFPIFVLWTRKMKTANRH
jgi:hypothetical protein